MVPFRINASPCEVPVVPVGRSQIHRRLGLVHFLACFTNLAACGSGGSVAGTYNGTYHSTLQPSPDAAIRQYDLDMTATVVTDAGVFEFSAVGFGANHCSITGSVAGVALTPHSGTCTSNITGGGTSVETLQGGMLTSNGPVLSGSLMWTTALVYDGGTLEMGSDDWTMISMTRQ